MFIENNAEMELVTIMLQIHKYHTVIYTMYNQTCYSILEIVSHV